MGILNKNIILFFVFFVCIFSYSQENFDNYFEYTKYWDGYFQKELKLNPKDSVLLKKQKKYNRVRRFWDTRVDESGSYKEYAKVIKASINEDPFTRNSNESRMPFFGSWQPIDNPAPIDGPSMMGFSYTRNVGKGRANCLWVNPDDANNVIMGTFSGIFETNNALETNGEDVDWVPLTDDIPIHTVRKIEKREGKIYAASGFRYLSIWSTTGSLERTGLGVVRSDNGGQDWDIPNFGGQIPNGFDCYDFELLDNGVIYAIDRNTLYRSSDDGNTWSIIKVFDELEGASRGLMDIVISPTNPNIIWITGNNSNNFVNGFCFFSNDGGLTWENKFDELLSLIPQEVLFGTTMKTANFSFEGDRLLLALAKGGSSKNVVFESTLDWEDFDYSYSFYSSGALRFFKRNQGVDYVYGMPNMRVHRLGEINSESLTYNKIHDDVRDVAFSKDKKELIFAANDGGISRSFDGGENWENINGNYIGFLIVSMGYYSDMINRAYDIGTQDTGYYRNDLDGLPMYWIREHEGGAYTSPTIQDRAFFKRYGSRLEYTPDGLVRNGSTTNVPIALEAHKNNQVLEDPLENNRVFAGAYNVLRYLDDLSTTNHVDISPPHHDRDYFKSQVFWQTGLDVSSNDNDNILMNAYCFENGDLFPGINKLYFSRDKGTSWNLLNIHPYLNQTHEALMATDVHLHDYEPSKMWVSYGNLHDGIKVFQSEDFGESWKNISYNLPNIPINEIEYDENREMLFIGTDLGVFYLDGSVWHEVGRNLPKAIVTDMYIDDYRNLLVVSLFGRGVWEIELERCNDRLVAQNETWDRDIVICGDLIIRPNITLTINDADVKAQNIILMRGAQIIWNNGTLNSNNSDQSYVVCAAESNFSLHENIINDYIINTFNSATVSLNKNLKLNDSKINNYDLSYFNYQPNVQITLNNSSVNFYNEYIFGSNPLLGLNNQHIDRLDMIDMYGNGEVNVYNEQIYIQDENLIKGKYNFIANDFVETGSNVTSSLPNLSFTTSNDVRVDILAKNYVLLDKGTFINNKDFFAHIDGEIDDVLVEPNRFNQLSSNVLNDFRLNNEVENTEENLAIEFYPNPTNGIVNYLKKTGSELRLKVYDNYGNLIKIKKLGNSLEGMLDLTGRKNGIYYIIVEYPDSKICKFRVIKK